MTDIEAPVRRELIKALGPAFHCVEEVPLIHPMTGQSMRADVVAVAVDGPYQDCALAFEVKVPKSDWQGKNWAHTLRQAHSYLDATVRFENTPARVASVPIALAFIYPSPGWNMGRDRTFEDIERAGMLQLAGNLRVGHAEWRVERSIDDGPTLRLALGATPIWMQRKGWTSWAEAHFRNGIVVGSRRLLPKPR